MESHGTSKDQALLNQSQREEIASHPDVKALFHTYETEKGHVILDHKTATKHIRAVLNEMKKKRYKGLYDSSFVSYCTCFFEFTFNVHFQCPESSNSEVVGETDNVVSWHAN